MAEEELKNIENQGKKKKGFNFKVILIGLPLFVVQLVLVYFITATFLVKNTSSKKLENSSEVIENYDDENSSEDSEENKNQTPDLYA